MKIQHMILTAALATAGLAARAETISSVTGFGKAVEFKDVAFCPNEVPSDMRERLTAAARDKSALNAMRNCAVINGLLGARIGDEQVSTHCGFFGAAVNVEVTATYECFARPGGQK